MGKGRGKPTVISSLFNYADPNSLVSRLRQRRSQLLRELIADVTAVKGICRVLDVGRGGELLADHLPHRLAAREPRPCDAPEHTDGYVGTPDPELFAVVIADGCALPYGDNVFDLTRSNSVIEHVGDGQRQRRFSGEFRRVGLNHYLHTPARCFPLEPHVRFVWFQYLPSAARVWLFRHLSLGTYPRLSRERAEHFDRELQLLTRRRLRSLFPDASLHRERLFGLTKSYMVVRLESGS